MPDDENTVAKGGIAVASACEGESSFFIGAREPSIRMQLL
jgi:hypothetical protein